MSELGEIREMLLELTQRQAAHAAEQTAIKADVETIKHVLLEGNGKPAMTVRLAIAEHELERFREERNDSKVPRSIWLGIVVSLVVGIAGVVAAMV